MKQIIENKGITLIALVITIIVLLILAGVSIATLTGENGVLTKAETAKNQTEKKSLEEQIDMAIMAAKMKNENPTLDDIIEEIKNNGVITNANQVNKETGDVTSNSGYVITGKLNNYIINNQKIQNTINLITTAQNALDDISNMVARMEELSISVTNPTNEEQERIAMQEEVTALLEAIDTIISETKFDERILLDGTFSDKVNIENETITIVIQNMSTEALGIKDLNINTENTTEIEAEREKLQNAEEKIRIQKNDLDTIQNKLQTQLDKSNV